MPEPEMPPVDAAGSPSDLPGAAPVDAGFFDLILETDLANIIRKAQTGQPLTKREREMIEEERTRRQKQGTLPDFKLEGEGAIGSLERMTQRELAAAWGYSPRQLKNWLADGRKANDPAPVTHPELMCTWFQRIYAPRDAPEKLRASARRLIEGYRGNGGADSHGANQAPPRIEVADKEKGLLAMIDRYRTAEATLHARYMAAVEAGDESKSQFYLAEWSKMGEKVRQMERTAPKALEEMGVFVRRDQVQRELEPLHAAILKGFRQGFRLARNRLRAAQSPEEWAMTVDSVVDEIAQMLCDTRFAEPLELEAA